MKKNSQAKVGKKKFVNQKFLLTIAKILDSRESFLLNE